MRCPICSVVCCCLVTVFISSSVWCCWTSLWPLLSCLCVSSLSTTPGCCSHSSRRRRMSLVAEARQLLRLRSGDILSCHSPIGQASFLHCYTMLSISKVCILIGRCEKHRQADGSVIAVGRWGSVTLLLDVLYRGAAILHTSYLNSFIICDYCLLYECP